MPRPSFSRKAPSLRRDLLWRVLLALLVGGGIGALYEIKTSRLQSEVFTHVTQDFAFALEPSRNPLALYPESAPYDSRLGYDRLGEILSRLEARNYWVEAQARMSPAMAEALAMVGTAPYRERTQAGLLLLDRNGDPLFQARFPGRVYETFGEIPEVLLRSLLYIEDRDLLSAPSPRHNPAIDWSRFPSIAEALLRKARDAEVNVPGGSTLATQIEKFRHAPGGRTASAKDKLRQMLAASLRAYLEGPDTETARRRILVDYLNSTPLSALPGFGEVNGMGDGLSAWYGLDFAQANRLLNSLAPVRREHLYFVRAGLPGENYVSRNEPPVSRPAARAFKQALSLLLAQRRPSYYLLEGRDALAHLTDSYLRALGRDGIIGPSLRKAALAEPLAFRGDALWETTETAIAGKVQQSLRADLVTLLGEQSLYTLDHLDLTARSTIDAPVQAAVEDLLRRLGDQAFLQQAGLTGERLLGEGDPANVIYSFTLFERQPGRNAVRVQADNLDQPLDINEGAKLDLGSTAKLRTLATYLTVVAKLYDRYGSLRPEELAQLSKSRRDPLTAWVLEQLAETRGLRLAPLLEAAMQRRYSASPTETFFTGGGLHTFNNFDSRDDRRIVTVAEALRNSINLPFVRLMRDIVSFYVREADSSAAALLSDPHHPGRGDYLARFADKEGRVFLNRFWNLYAGLEPQEILALAARRARARPNALAVVYHDAVPEATLAGFAAWVATQPGGGAIGDAAVSQLFENFAPERWSLADRAYIARLHPLELWLAGYLARNPKAGREQAMAASDAERIDAYDWLLRSDRARAQNSRIRTLLEEDAFELIHQLWQDMGYPFESLVPSLATALGSSADRPAALAELMGIIVNDGRRLPTVRIDRLHFAKDTPFEAVLEASSGSEQQVMKPEVAARLRAALVDVVENGTGRRAAGAVTLLDGRQPVIGGKTGTGDHRYKEFRGGRLISSRAVNRNACFVFFIGERFFGTVVAHVKGPEADGYRFTSALPAQIFKLVAPALQPLFQEHGGQLVAAGIARPPS